MSFSWKTARNIMRKDQGISSDVQRLEELISLVFLRIYDALEEEWEDEADNDGREFNSVFAEEKYKWHNWALPDENGKTLTGDELLTLVDELFKYCKKVNVEALEPRQRIIRKVFTDLNQYMKDGTNLRELVDVVNELNYHDAKQRNLFGQIYEEMLKLLQGAGSAGEFYTPRAVTKFIVEMLNPRVGETFGDFACGTGGFLTAAIDFFHEQKNVSNEDVKKINNSIFGFEYKPFPYLLCNTNLLVHGIDTPQIEYGSAFCKPINDFDETEKVDVIAMNPPYGGVTTAAELTNFPAQFKTSETAVLFIAYITKRLKQNGRAGVIIPDGFLFGNDNASVEVKKVLIEQMNLHTIIRLPSSVFAPYTSITTNILFFDNKKPTEDLWIYRMDMPEDLKHFSKTKPITDEHMEVVKHWWNNRSEIAEEGNEKARCFKKSEIAVNGYNLDLCKYPKEEEEILSIKDTIINYKKHSEAAEEKINSTLAKISEILGIEL